MMVFDTGGNIQIQNNGLPQERAALTDCCCKADMLVFCASSIPVLHLCGFPANASNYPKCPPSGWVNGCWTEIKPVDRCLRYLVYGPVTSNLNGVVSGLDSPRIIMRAAKFCKPGGAEAPYISSRPVLWLADNTDPPSVCMDFNPVTHFDAVFTGQECAADPWLDNIKQWVTIFLDRGRQLDLSKPASPAIPRGTKLNVVVAVKIWEWRTYGPHSSSPGQLGEVWLGNAKLLVGGHYFLDEGWNEPGYQYVFPGNLPEITLCPPWDGNN